MVTTPRVPALSGVAWSIRPTVGYEQNGSAAALLLLPVVACVVAVLLMSALTARFNADEATADPCASTDASGRPQVSIGSGMEAGGIHLDPEQVTNAATIVRVAIRLRLPAGAARIALAVAMQESSLRNLSGGDRDSAGLFQQRTGWGTLTQRTTPESAATMFYTGGHVGQPGLIDIASWPSMPLTVAGQAVQRSATPAAYATWTRLAGDLLTRLWPRTGLSPSGPPPPPAPAPSSTADTATDAQVGDCGDAAITGPATAAISAGLRLTGSRAGNTAARFALAQLGKPYQWAAAGPDAYDCSGLTMAAWLHAGYGLTHFTGDQVQAGTRVPGLLTGARSGDLVFIPGSHGGNGRLRHVGLVAGVTASHGAQHLWIIHAPGTGQVVQLTDASTWATQIGAVRHIS
jgi:cell wall-associated NlpC family hydrolase